MTKFVRAQFEYFGGYLHYKTNEGERKFVARFKHDKADRAPFTKFLIANFSVEEYFTAYADGLGMAPLKILETKGYISTNIRRAMSQVGATTVQELLDIMRQQREARQATTA